VPHVPLDGRAVLIALKPKDGEVFARENKFTRSSDACAKTSGATGTLSCMVRARIVSAACAALSAAVVANAHADDVLPPLPVPLPTVSTPLVGTSSSSSSTPSSGQTPQRAARTTAVAVATEDARALVVEINRIRRAHKLRVLRVSPQLTRAGTEHAKALALAGLFTHAWPGGTPFSAWIRRYYSPFRFRVWSTGENLVWRSPDLTARDAVQMWLASPPHRRNLLNASWRELGLGVVRAQAAPGAYGGSDVELAAAEFGKRRR
jgi:uncharacterized protein YkwD